MITNHFLTVHDTRGFYGQYRSRSDCNEYAVWSLILTIQIFILVFTNALAMAIFLKIVTLIFYLDHDRWPWLVVVLGLNATLTAKVTSRRSVMHMCFLAFSHRYLNNFSFQRHRLLFWHASAEVRGENTPERKVASTGDQTRNHQVMSSTRSPHRARRWPWYQRECLTTSNTITKGESSIS